MRIRGGSNWRRFRAVREREKKQKQKKSNACSRSVSVKMSMWRHDVLPRDRSILMVRRCTTTTITTSNTWIPRPTHFHGFQFCRRWSPTRFFRGRLSFTLAPFRGVACYLIRGSLIRARGREWTAKDRLVLFHGLEILVRSVSLPWSHSFHPHGYPRRFPFGARTPKARAFKRYNRVAFWKLMHSIVDLCTIHVEYIGTHPVYEINFVHAPLASRPCNYQ